jgi:hypothetical protein
MTASPVGSIRAMSKTGVRSSPASEERFGASSEAAPTVSREAAVAAPASTGSSRRTWGTPKKSSAAPPAATSARDGTTIRAIDAAVSMTRLRGLRHRPAPNGHGHQAHLRRPLLTGAREKSQPAVKGRRRSPPPPRARRRRCMDKPRRTDGPGRLSKSKCARRYIANALRTQHRRRAFRVC